MFLPFGSFQTLSRYYTRDAVEQFWKTTWRRWLLKLQHDNGASCAWAGRLCTFVQSRVQDASPRARTLNFSRLQFLYLLSHGHSNA